MKFYNWLIKYRLYIGLVMIVAGLAMNLTISGFWPVFPLYLVGVILIAGHFFFGPLRLIQEHMESGNMEEAEKIVNSIKYGNVRCASGKYDRLKRRGNRGTSCIERQPKIGA